MNLKSVALAVLSLNFCLQSCSGGSNQSETGSATNTSLAPVSAILSDGPFFFGQNLLTAVIPTRITFTSAGGNINTTTEVSYSSATRTLSRVSSLTSSGNSIAASETVYEFDSDGQVILEISLNNGDLTQVVNNFYENGLLIRREYRTTFESETEFVRTLEYDDTGRFTNGETTDLSSNEFISRESRVYSQNGWTSTTTRGPVTTRIVTQLDDRGRITRLEESTSNGIGGFLRTTTQSFDENDQRLSEQRFRDNAELIGETVYSDFVAIDDVIQDRLYQWEVFFDPSDF